MPKLKFSDPIYDRNLPAVTAFDNYFSFKKQKYQVINSSNINNKKVEYVEEIHVKSNTFIDVLKIISYTTVIIPIIMGVGKIITRKQHCFLISSSLTSQTVTPFTQKLPKTSFKVFTDKLQEVEEGFNSTCPKIEMPLPSSIEVNQAYEHHQICNQLVKISDRLQNEEIKKVWQDYLTKINNTPILYSDGQTRFLKTSFAKKRLIDYRPNIQIKKLDVKPSEVEINKIVKLEKECFSSHELINNHNYDENIHKDRLKRRFKNNAFYVAYVPRDGIKGDKIVGVLEYEDERNNIFSLLRKASYARCDIAKLLWERLLNEHQDQAIDLYVRSSNPAREVYKKWGFKEVQTIENFYQQPKEAAYKMRRLAQF